MKIRERWNRLKFIYAKLKYWYPVLIEDSNDDFVCVFAILNHKLKSIQRERPNDASLNRCIQDLNTLTYMAFNNEHEFQKLLDGVCEVIRTESTRWYK